MIFVSIRLSELQVSALFHSVAMADDPNQAGVSIIVKTGDLKEFSGTDDTVSYRSNTNNLAIRSGSTLAQK